MLSSERRLSSQVLQELQGEPVSKESQAEFCFKKKKRTFSWLDNGMKNSIYCFGRLVLLHFVVLLKCCMICIRLVSNGLAFIFVYIGNHIYLGPDPTIGSSHMVPFAFSEPYWVYRFTHKYRDLQIYLQKWWPTGLIQSPLNLMGVFLLVKFNERKPLSAGTWFVLWSVQWVAFSCRVFHCEEVVRIY